MFLNPQTKVGGGSQEHRLGSGPPVEKGSHHNRKTIVPKSLLGAAEPLVEGILYNPLIIAGGDGQGNVPGKEPCIEGLPHEVGGSIKKRITKLDQCLYSL